MSRHDPPGISKPRKKSQRPALLLWCFLLHSQRAMTPSSFRLSRPAKTALTGRKGSFLVHSGRALGAPHGLPGLHQTAWCAAPVALVGFLYHPYVADFLRHSTFPCDMAGVPGFEPGLSVLETDVLTVDTIPLHTLPIANFRLAISHCRNTNRQSAIGNRQCYLVSLWPVCLRQRRQNLENSSRSGVVFLFLVVT